MRTSPTSDECDAYRRDGFLAVPRFLDAGELDRWRHAVDCAVAEREGRKLPASVAAEEDGYYERVFNQRMNLWQTSAAVRELVFDQRLGRFAAELAGVDGIRIFHDQALIKPAWGNPTAFHLDVPFWSFTSPDAISVWVALDDATTQNGCLCYVPGSHRVTRYDNAAIGPELGALFERYPEYAGIDPVPCPVPAGGALFHNGLIAHGAGANLTPRPRRAMTVQFMPDGATFNGIRSVLPADYTDGLQVGDRLDEDAHLPLVYSRRPEASGRS